MRSSKTLYIDTETLLDMKKLGEENNMKLNSMFEVAAKSLLFYQKEGEWPNFNDILQQVKTNSKGGE